MCRKSCTGLQSLSHACDKLNMTFPLEVTHSKCMLNSKSWMHIKLLGLQIVSFYKLHVFHFSLYQWISFLCVKTFNSSKAETNEEVTKRVMEAIVADHMGTEKCPWSASEMKGMNKELELFAGLWKGLTASLHFDQNLPTHPEIIHPAFSILLKVIPAIPQPPFGMKICSDICLKHYLLQEANTFPSAYNVL